MTFSLPMTAIATLAGMCCAIFVPKLPMQHAALILIAVGLVFIYLNSKRLISMLGCALLGFGLISFHVNLHILHLLPEYLEGKKITVEGTISSVVENHKKTTSKFNFTVKKIHSNDSWQLPAIIQLSWRNSKYLQPGEVWRFDVKVKRPRNFANPGSFDLERHCLQQRVVALGYVLDSGQNKHLDTNLFFSPINTLRQNLYSFIHNNLSTQVSAPLLSSLLLGLRANIAKHDYEVLQATGTSHLLAISGLHIGILAAIIVVVLRFILRLIPNNKIAHAPILAILSTAICLGYGLVAGFAVATQRAIVMMLALLLATLLKRKTNAWYSFSGALLLVIIWDPLSILSVGFWFSFVAVAFLLYAVNISRAKNIKQKIYVWMHPQIVLSIGLLPLSLLFFAKTSLIGPIANLIAIPWVAFTILPMGFIAILIIPLLPNVSVALLHFAANSFSYLLPVLNKLAQVPTIIFTIPDNNLFLIIACALIGSLWLLAPRGVPLRAIGILGFLPLFFTPKPVVPYGEVDFTLLDVGQGLAAVVRTKSRVLIYDTGAKLGEFDLGKNVVVPYLHSLGIDNIDTLLISHADNDHVGGAESILAKIPVQNIIASEENIIVNQQNILCKSGMSWHWDGVEFNILHPSHEFYRKRNDRSCVLMIKAKGQKVLLTGDIEKSSETELINAYGDYLKSSVMLVPHHGSKTSSSEGFIDTVQPEYALIPVGYKNRYGHPKEEVLARYRARNIKLLSTEKDGAINIRLGQDIRTQLYKLQHRRFWYFDTTN